jgi:hypothetical protein
MLGLLVGMDAARRVTEELLTYDESPRGRTRKRRRGSSRPRRTVSLQIQSVPRSVEGSRETPTDRPVSSHASRH